MFEYEVEYIFLLIFYFVFEELEYDKYVLVFNILFIDVFIVVNVGVDKLIIKLEVCLLWFGKLFR